MARMTARLIASASILTLMALPALAQNGPALLPGQDAAGTAPVIEREIGRDGTVTFEVRPQAADGGSVRIERWLDAFEAEVSLRVRTDPRLIPSERLTQLVASIGMVDDAGIAVVSGYDIDVAHDLVLGFSGGTAEITNIQKTPMGFVITALFKDAEGNIVQPPSEALALYTTGGEKLCFAEETVQQLVTNRSPASSSITTPGLPMTFAILLDRSGSMQNVMEDVKRAAHGFIDSLPVGATCAVGAFADEGGTFDAALGLGVGNCRSSNFPLTGVHAGGGTDLFRPLESTYRWLQDAGRADHQTAVIIITDGELNGSLELQASVEALKGDTVTFVYFLGGHEERFLKSLADNYLTHEGAVSEALPRYFEVVTEAYTSQTVLRQSACPAPEAVRNEGAP